jgi:hypothetical protein
LMRKRPSRQKSSPCSRGSRYDRNTLYPKNSPLLAPAPNPDTGKREIRT